RCEDHGQAGLQRERAGQARDRRRADPAPGRRARSVARPRARAGHAPARPDRRRVRPRDRGRSGSGRALRAGRAPARRHVYRQGRSRTHRLATGDEGRWTAPLLAHAQCCGAGSGRSGRGSGGFAGGGEAVVGGVRGGELRGRATFPGRARARARARARVRGYEGHRRGGTTSPDREYVLNRPGFAGGRNFRGIGVMNEAKRYSREIRERAVRLVLDPEGEYPSQWAAIESMAEKIGCSSDTLRRWVRQAERDEGKRPGARTAELERIKGLERENRELRR